MDSYDGRYPERRRRNRYRVCFPVSIDAGERTNRMGIVRDVSASGVCLNTPSRFDPGESVSITLLLPEQKPGQIRVSALVVRVEDLNLESKLLWRYLAAFRFEDSLDDLEEYFRGMVQPGDSGSTHSLS